jgi:hypothetical protein
MTPKEKSIDLYSKFYSRIQHHLSDEYLPHDNDVVKQCTLVSIDEILLLNWQTQENAYYWYAVKKEIEKL